MKDLNISLLDTIFTIYLAFAMFLPWIPSDFIRAFLVSPLLLILPLLFGKTILNIIFNDDYININIIFKYTIFWFTGLYLLYIFSSILVLLKIFVSIYFIYALIIFILSYNIKKTFYVNNNLNLKYLTLKKYLRARVKISLIYVIILFNSIIPLFFIIIKQPFPYTSTAAYLWIYRSLELVRLNYLELSHGYAPIVSMLYGYLSIISSCHPIQLFSVSKYIMHLIFPFSVYFLSMKLKKNIYIAMLSAFIAPWIILIGSLKIWVLENTSLLFLLFPLLLYTMLEISSQKTHVNIKYKLLLALPIFSSPIGYIMMNEIPSSLFFIFTIFIPIFSLILCTITDIKNASYNIFFIMPLLTITTIHPYLGTLQAIILLIFIISYNIYLKNKLLIKIIAFIFLLLSMFLMFGIIKFDDIFLFSKYFFGNMLKYTPVNIDLNTKLTRFLREGPSLAIFLFFISMAYIILFERTKINLLTIISSIILFLTFLPEGTFYRVWAWNNPIISIIISNFLIAPLQLKNISIQNNSINIELKKINHMTKINIKHMMYVFIIIIIIIPNFANPKLNYYNNLSKTNPEGYLSYLQSYDLESALWLDENINNNTILLSDPYTMFILHSLTMKNTLLEEYIYIIENEYSKEVLELINHLKTYVFSEKDTTKLYGKLINFVSENIHYPYDRIILVLNPRFFDWLSKGGFITFPSKAIIDESNMILFNDSSLSKELYINSNKLYIYEVINKSNIFSEWSNSKKINITYQNITRYEDFQLKMTIYRGVGSDNGSHIYLNNCKEDFGDVRFSNGMYEFNYWIQEVNDNKAIFWINIERTTNNDQKLYIHYGNLNASTTSNGTDTFQMFNSNNVILYCNYDTINGSYYNDLSKYEANISATNVSEPMVSNGKFNKSVYLDGIDDFITIPHVSIFNLSRISISLWISPNENELPFRWIISKGTNNWEIIKHYSNIRIESSTTQGVTKFNTISGLLQPNKWYNIIYSYDGYKHKLYINGKVEDVTYVNGPFFGSMMNTTQSIYIGTRNNDGRYYNGLVDEIYIFNKSVTEYEAQSIFSNRLIKIGDYYVVGNLYDLDKNINFDIKIIE